MTLTSYQKVVRKYKVLLRMKFKGSPERNILKLLILKQNIRAGHGDQRKPENGKDYCWGLRTDSRGFILLTIRIWETFQ